MDVKSAVLADADIVQEFIILLADAGGQEPVRGRTKLQKMLFVASRAGEYLGDQGCFELGDQGCFELGDRGPYSEVVDKEVEYLASIGVLDIVGTRIAITRTGRRIAKELSREAGADIVTMLRNIKGLLNDLRTRDLQGYIYAAYPETRYKSTEYKTIKPQIEKILVSLIRKEKISSGHAAKLLGKPLHYVIELMKDAGIAYLH